jgi:iron complex outermembrane recepter protein
MKAMTLHRRTNPHRIGSLALAGFAATLAWTDSIAENPAEVLELSQVQVVGTTPLPGSGVPLRNVPANVQIFTSRDLRRQGAANLTDFLEQNPSGVTVNAAQGNPYQPDINFRGFSASPLLGTPQGVSVFFDGVRINEPFGDSVNWDLITQSAISSIQLIPGSNPAFGLNTLGGAIALYTKSGASQYPDDPGGFITASGGAFGRRTLGVETGGKSGPWDWFITGNDARDKGWALHNPSHVRQMFAKLGWQDDQTDLDLTLSSANNRLEGTQTLPLGFDDIRQPYTFPDTNENRATLVALKGSQAVSDNLLLSGNVYLRRFRNRNISSNVNDDFAATNVEAINDAAEIDQAGHGYGAQLVHSATLGGRANKLTLGFSVDRGNARFTRSRQDAAFTPERGTIALTPFQSDTDSDSTTGHLGVFASDVLSLDERWAVTLAGRFNRATVDIADRSGNAPELNGSHRFSRFNPAVGLSFNPTPALTNYASYNEGMRAPTAIELTCADPNAPCKLPNSFLSDPPLKKVVSKTFEVGARGKLAADTSWSAAIFRTDLRDDLQFISSNGLATNAGYFQNVGDTRRQGLELGGTTQFGALAVTVHYSLIDASYRTGFVENSPNNSSADANGGIVVRPGDRIPGVPRQSLKLRLELEATPRWSIGLNTLLASSVHARGDENNLDLNGRIPGYAVLHLDSRYQATKNLSLFARVDNLFDRRYANFGILGQNVFTGPGLSFDAANARAEQFRGYGAPRAASAGVQYTFD